LIADLDMPVTPDPEGDGREQLLDSLLLGGRLLIADIRGTRQHQAQLARIGMSDVIRGRLGWRFWWGGPWAATRLVTVTKPKAATQE
jgi:arsenite methyltransferase